MADVSRRLARAAHRLADQNTGRLAELPRGRDLKVTVLTVTAGVATDGGSVVTVSYRGAELTCAAYITPHVPVVGMRALCRITDDGELILLGRLGGFPPEQ